MRGILHLRAPVLDRRRFIPAHAGNSTSRPWRAYTRTVHPRACGEFHRPHPRRTVTAGSSPRMRGIRIPFFGRRPVRRFIPAHAGNSRSRPAGSASRSVHPRACGEFRRFLRILLHSAGSSPRMRGIHHVFRRPGPRLRFIPAHAGNSTGRRGRRWRRTVHPRACGEFTSSISLMCKVKNSSLKSTAPGPEPAASGGGRGLIIRA